jgi:hypothetical protein
VSCTGPAVIGPNGVTFADGTKFPTASIEGIGDEAIRCDYQSEEFVGCGVGSPLGNLGDVMVPDACLTTSQSRSYRVRAKASAILVAGQPAALAHPDLGSKPFARGTRQN